MRGSAAGLAKVKVIHHISLLLIIELLIRRRPSGPRDINKLSSNLHKWVTQEMGYGLNKLGLGGRREMG